MAATVARLDGLRGRRETHQAGALVLGWPRQDFPRVGLPLAHAARKEVARHGINAQHPRRRGIVVVRAPVRASPAALPGAPGRERRACDRNPRCARSPPDASRSTPADCGSRRRAPPGRAPEAGRRMRASRLRQAAARSLVDAVNRSARRYGNPGTRVYCASRTPAWSIASSSAWYQRAHARSLSDGRGQMFSEGALHRGAASGHNDDEDDQRPHPSPSIRIASRFDHEKQRSAASRHGSQVNATCSSGAMRTGAREPISSANTCSTLCTTPGAKRCRHCA